jgi:ParB family chromosome partitioning protein
MVLWLLSSLSKQMPLFSWGCLLGLTFNRLPGLVEELSVGQVRQPRWSIRIDSAPLEALMASIAEKGLLQPIVVRPIVEQGYFEVVAGSRRLEACRRLGLRRIAAHVVEMDDKDAYEVSIVENVQRKAFDAVEEARAYKRYVDEYGYGSVSELALKIGKSEEYVSHRIGLLSLPDQVLEQVSRRRLTPSHAAELKGLGGEESLRISQIIVEERMPAKEVRQLVKKAKSGAEQSQDSQSPPFLSYDPYSVDSERERDMQRIDRTFGRCIAAMKTMMMRFDRAIDGMDERSEWVVRDLLLENRNAMHQHIDNMLRMKRKTRYAWQLRQRDSADRSSCAGGTQQ